ncbi:MAG: cyclic nucleotide-binding domain-containing protein [Proteobacteria bacterium]|nr:cyclic nucleotide-binding domain-containing protein [Pseudomonadota bacterium]MBU4130624.1 cyclic nucleotide-binding domain-containing protein [Pseudomonadota bacterium]
MAKNLQANLVNDKTIAILKKFMIFDDLVPADIKKILSLDANTTDAYQNRIIKLCQYKAGEVVIREGEFDCWSFWVVKGVFDVIQNGQPIASFSNSGEIFGEMSVLEGIPRTASVVSVTSGVCLCIDMSVIETMEDEGIRTTIKNGFYKVILARLGRTKDKMMAEKQQLEIKYAGLLSFEEKIRAKAQK